MKSFSFQKGFTLIEIIISLTILAVGLVGILSLFPLGFDLAKRSENSIQAAIFAQKKLEEIRKAGFPATGTTSGTFDPTFSWQAVVADATPTGYLRQVTLTVSWNYRGKSYQESFITYIAKYAP